MHFVIDGEESANIRPLLSSPFQFPHRLSSSPRTRSQPKDRLSLFVVAQKATLLQQFSGRRKGIRYRCNY